jgi:hypothetical protein
MANMGYCRFELTLKDLKDCYNNMQTNLSDKEHEYRMQLLELCNSITEEFSDCDFEEIQNEEEV